MSGDPAFSRGGAFGLIFGGFALFLALIWLIGAGEGVGGGNNGEAHAAAKGLNGYAGLVRLVAASGYDAVRSRSPAGLETDGLLVLTPPPDADAQQIGAILEKRENIGPTLVILPKWSALGPPQVLPSAVRERFKPGWVILDDAFATDWPKLLPGPYGFTHKLDILDHDRRARWNGLGLTGSLPTAKVAHAVIGQGQTQLVGDGSGRVLAMRVGNEEGTDVRANTHWTVFLAEPDLANNYGLADRQRAAAALALIDAATQGGAIDQITFDLTLNGFGPSENLLTLALRPPFLAATLCLLLALVIIGWRAFKRFGGAAAEGGPAIAFGKARLIANGAGLILRARRFHLLGAPYAALSARRLAERLGLARPDPDALDQALARRLPLVEPFSRRAARLEAAGKPADILAAAQALDDLVTKLSHQGK
ncbi:DUF4350 domain-containing protein [Erythrobacter tepidarius]|uniref:DUF4350 domain-containing protein n=1 Tax=Erythrobacter tepidarius TaxID=60454 RepID=UPI000A3BB48D|nr:DUF4350 domain-containing protein [Erythrobacter tepidarius]